MPTTYSGAEWTTFYGIRTPDRRIQGGGAGAHPAAIVYDVDLTLDLPLAESGGTALNALAHCAEALYVRGRNPEGDEAALSGAALIAGSLPRVLAAPHDRQAREELLRGAADAGPRARPGGPRSRPRDGPGARWHLRDSARRDERPLPATRAGLQPGARPG